MILEHQGDLSAFRSAVRKWLEVAVPPYWQNKIANATHDQFYEFQKWWFQQRQQVGLAIPHWPLEYGGANLGLKHQVIVAEEFARANAPSSDMYTISLIHVPATLIAWGTDEQKTRYLAGVSRGDVWCQGFSEPNAGSDLASLKTRAVRDDDCYVVNGQKTWSTNSMYSDFCILLARTDLGVRKHAGITYFIMDMRSPGVEVRPIRQPNGRSEFGEIFLTDVKIPLENRVGPENQGWSVTQSTLTSERGVLAFESIERLHFTFERLFRDALEVQPAWLGDDELRREFMVLFAELQASRRMVRAVLGGHDPSNPTLDLLPTIIKLFRTTWRQRFSNFLVKLGGLGGQEFILAADNTSTLGMYNFITSFAYTISGGTNEIMRNIIAERGLGLPR
jgi:alkylation response protein AidB-like acyl-CoA dehydrogenase